MLGGLYPGIFCVLLAANAIHRNADFIPFLIPLFITIIILGSVTGYIFYPRAFQRYFKILDIESSGENIYLTFSNPEYRTQFLETNPMHAEIIDFSSLDLDTHE
jgi:hypothetical protein